MDWRSIVRTTPMAERIGAGAIVVMFLLLIFGFAVVTP